MRNEEALKGNIEEALMDKEEALRDKEETLKSDWLKA